MTKDVRTVVVLATPPGAGAIAVIRLSGIQAASMIKAVFGPSALETNPGDPRPFESLFHNNRVRYGQFRSGNEVIDDVLVSEVPGGSPLSFDICTHGGVRIVERVLQKLESLGAVLVTGDEAAHIIWPSVNRIEQEAMSALTHALTERAIRFLAWQRSHLVSALEEMESRTDKERDDTFGRLERLHLRYESAKLLLNGATIALVGPPNSGKSTLFNRFVGRDATIVSPRAGTTRDWVTAKIELDGVPLTLIDTAGDHAKPEALEKLAIDSGKGRVLNADLCILVLDGSIPITDAESNLAAAQTSYPNCLMVTNKCDIGVSWKGCEMSGIAVEPTLAISAKTGEGLKGLIRSISQYLGFRDWVDYQPSAFTFRHYSVVHEVLADRTCSSQDLQVAIKRLLNG